MKQYQSSPPCKFAKINIMYVFIITETAISESNLNCTINPIVFKLKELYMNHLFSSVALFYYIPE